MAVSTLTVLEPKFGFDQVDKSLSNQLSSIRLHDDAPNNPDLQHRDLHPGDPGAEKSKREDNETGLEFELAGPIDHLALFCKEEEDDRLLDAHGGGYKRPQTRNQQGEEVPAKKSSQRTSLQTCSPPQQAVYLSFNTNGFLASRPVQVFSTGNSSLPNDVSPDGAANEKALQISKIVADLMSPQSDDLFSCPHLASPLLNTPTPPAGSAVSFNPVGSTGCAVSRDHAGLVGYAAVSCGSAGSAGTLYSPAGSTGSSVALYSLAGSEGTLYNSDGSTGSPESCSPAGSTGSPEALVTKSPGNKDLVSSTSLSPTFVPSPPPSLSHSILQSPSISPSAATQSYPSTSVAVASSKLPTFASPEEVVAREQLRNDMLGSQEMQNNMQSLTQGKKLPLAGAQLRNMLSSEAQSSALLRNLPSSAAQISPRSLNQLKNSSLTETQNSPQSFNQLRNPPLTEAPLHTQLCSHPFNGQQRELSNANAPLVQSKGPPNGAPNEGLTQTCSILVGPPRSQSLEDSGRAIVSAPSLNSLLATGPPDSRSLRIPVGSTQATGPPNLGQRAHHLSTVGPPTIQNTSSPALRETAFLQTSKTTTLTRASESDIPSSSRVQGPYPGRSSSDSFRARSASGEMIRTCINNKPMSGGRVMCNDMSPPIIPPSPISPFSNDSVFMGSPSRNYSDHSSRSHVSPIYSFPPTPESDCSSMKGSPTQIAEIESCQSPSNGSLQASPGNEGMCRDGVDSVRQNFNDSSSSVLYYPHPVSMGQHLQASPQSEGISGDAMDSARQNVSSSSSSSAPSYPHPVSLTFPPILVSSHPVPDNFLQKGDGEGEREVEEEEIERVLSFVRDENSAFRVDEDGDTFFHSLSGLENEQEAVMYLYRLRASPDFLQGLNAYNKLRETPLYNAVSFGKRTLVAALLELGADLNLQCHYGPKAHSPLHKAVEEGNYSIVDLLLHSPAIDLTAKRASDDCTALMAAVRKHVCGDAHSDRYNIIARIVQEEDTPNLQIKEPRSGKTVLMMAVETKDERVVDALLSDLDVDSARHLINIQNRAGNSAVHMAAGLRGVSLATQEQILEKLIRLGGETNKRNNEGETPKDWAKNLIDRVARFR